MDKVVIENTQREETREDAIKDLIAAEALLKEHGIPFSKEHSKYEYTNFKFAKDKFMYALRKAVGKDAVFLKSYEPIIEWLEGNNGNSLLLSGKCGTGKTVIATKVLPFIFATRGQLIHWTTAKKFAREGQIEGKCVWIIDDIGTEGNVKDYGTDIDKLGELLDKIESDGGMAIITTNLNPDDIMERYGERKYQRFYNNFVIVPIDEQTMRRPCDE